MTTTPKLATKTCSRCGQTKPLSDYWRLTKNKKDGRFNACIECARPLADVATQRRRDRMGDNAWLAEHRAVAKRARIRHAGKDTAESLANKAGRRALKKLRAAHPDEYDRLYRLERYELGLSV